MCPASRGRPLAQTPGGFPLARVFLGEARYHVGSAPGLVIRESKTAAIVITAKATP